MIGFDKGDNDMASALSANTAVRELDRIEHAVLDVLIDRFNDEIRNALRLVEPGKKFEVAVDEKVEVEGLGMICPSKIVMNAVAQAYRNQGWDVEKATPGYGVGAVSMALTRPPRVQPLVPDAAPISVADSKG